jgi:hypothetical protein
MTESTFSNVAPSKAIETAQIVQLDASTLVIRSANTNGTRRTLAFKRVDSPAVIASDDEYTHKLLGTWQYGYTNRAKVAGVRLYCTYAPAGTASWHGTIYRSDVSVPAPDIFGLWRVEHGFLVTSITNAPAASLPDKEARDQILQVTDSQFTFRDENGALKKYLRTQ